MKALSILQPWAWLIVNGYKDVENRTWPTNYRGPVLIHAGQRYVMSEWTAAMYLANRIGLQINAPKDKAYAGGIVGIATIIDCVTTSSSPWFCGPYGFVLADAQRLPFIPYRGQLGLFDVPDDAVPGLKEAGIV